MDGQRTGEHPDELRRLAQSARTAIAASDWQEARRALTALLAARPDDAALAYNLALVEKRLGLAAAAEARLAALLAAHPDHANARFEHAAALMDRGAEAEALEGFEACLRLDPNDADALLNAGRLYNRLGDPASAMERLAAAARLRPGDAAIALALAEAQRDAGDLTAADIVFRRLFATAPALRPAILKAMSQGPRGRLPLAATRLYR
jgi:tetratricopeptide (TPR) repeat protein